MFILINGSAVSLIGILLLAPPTGLNIVKELPLRPGVNQSATGTKSEAPIRDYGQISVPSADDLILKFRDQSNRNNGVSNIIISYRDKFLLEGCISYLTLPAGIARLRGDMHGVQELLRCENAIVLIYQFDYTLPLTQSVTIVDPDYASDPFKHRHRVKSGTISYANADVTYIGWISPEKEFKVEVYDYERAGKWGENAKLLVEDYVKNTIP